MYLLLGFSAFSLVSLLLSLTYFTLADDKEDDQKVTISTETDIVDDKWADQKVTISTETDIDDPDVINSLEKCVNSIRLYSAYYKQYLLHLPYRAIMMYREGAVRQYFTIQ